MNNFFNLMSETALKSANELIALNSRVLSKAMTRQTELGDIFASGSKQQVNLLQRADNPKEFAEKQSRLADQYAVIYKEAAKTNMSIALKTGEEYKAWIENNARAVNKLAQDLTISLKTAENLYPKA